MTGLQTKGTARLPPRWSRCRLSAVAAEPVDMALSCRPRPLAVGTGRAVGHGGLLVGGVPADELRRTGLLLGAPGAGTRARSLGLDGPDRRLDGGVGRRAGRLRGTVVPDVLGHR